MNFEIYGSGFEKSYCNQCGFEPPKSGRLPKRAISITGVHCALNAVDEISG